MKKSDTSYNWIIWLSLFSLLTYVVFRAVTFSITHDECLSFSIIQGLPFQVNSANNHVLNTFLMDWSSYFFGTSEIALRLPNVISFGFYLLGVFLLVKNKNTGLAFIGFTLLCIQPALLEYFSLARGYGISIGFMMLSLYFLTRINFREEEKKKLITDSFLTILFASLATHANLSMINYLIALLGLLTLQYILSSFQPAQRKLKTHFLFAFVVFFGMAFVFFEAERLLLLQERNELYFGEESMIKMFESLASANNYLLAYFDGSIQGTEYVVLACLMVGALFVIWKKQYDGPLLRLGLIIVFILFGLFLEAHLFKSKYPSGRSALFFVPLFALYLFLLIEKSISVFKIKPFVYLPFFLLFSAILYLNFYFSILRNSTKEWEFDAKTKEMMIYLKTQTQQANQKYTIANYWLFEPSINYYIDLWQVNLEPANRNAIDFSTDFIYRYKDESKVEGYQMILQFPESNTNLLQKINE